MTLFHWSRAEQRSEQSGEGVGRADIFLAEQSYNMSLEQSCYTCNRKTSPGPRTVPFCWENRALQEQSCNISVGIPFPLEL